jgi:hypothetical protein
MKNIYYIGYYSGLDNPNDFFEFPSSNSKMDYIISVIRRLNFNLSVMSLGFPKRPAYLYKKTRIIHFDKNTDFVFVSTISLFFPFFAFVSKAWLYLQVITFLLFKVKKNDIILVYHSFLLTKIVGFCRMLSKFKLVYEVEEIYQAVNQNSANKIEKEIKSLRNADGYILVNDIISNRLQLIDKPFVVCYGSYLKKDNIINLTSNKKINLVYAGFIGGEGSDVALAIETIKLLPPNYFLNILGYGNEENIRTLNRKIKSINAINDIEKVKYFGCLTGKEYDNFLAKCHIGLSTRVLIDEFSDFTFPSKIMVYLSNNLIPVSAKIKCIVDSKVSSSVVFYNENTPESVAQAISSIDSKKFNLDYSSLISDLDVKFLENFNEMLLYDID